MSFFKHFIPLKTKVWISLDKPSFADGEPVVGKVNVEANEYIQCQGVRVEARATENYQEMEWIVVNNQRIQENVRKQNHLFSRDENVSGPSDFGQGPARSFPFSVGIPTFRPTHMGGSVEYTVKGVLSVKGRPDATGTTQIAFGPPTGYPMMPPTMQPVGYGPQPMYGPAPGYPPQGYSPQGYAPAPGYSQPGMAPRYGQQYPQYAPQQQTQQAAKVRCKFCQTMIDQTSSVCPNCGGHQ